MTDTETPETPEPTEPEAPAEATPAEDSPDQETPGEADPDSGGESDGGTDEDSGGEEEGEGTTPEPPDESVSPEAIEKALKPVERTAKTYIDRMATFIETTEQPVIPCGVCAAFYPGFIFSPAINPLNEEQQSWMRQALGEPDKPSLIQATDAHMCEQCDGWGRVLTGSKRPDYSTRKCNGCNGRGWNGAGAQEVPIAPQNVMPTVEHYDEGPIEDAPTLDPWGRDATHPGFWVMPHPGMPSELQPPSIKNSVAPVA